MYRYITLNTRGNVNHSAYKIIQQLRQPGRELHKGRLAIVKKTTTEKGKRGSRKSVNRRVCKVNDAEYIW